MNKKIAFLTTVFPMNINYLWDFFNSLKIQTFKQFDVIVVNDGFDYFEDIRSKYKDLNIIELKYSNTPAKNREFGINYCIDNKYDVLIFGDSDDYFSENRVEKLVELLSDCDIVVNDLSLFNENGVYEEKYISNRVENNAIIDIEFIKDKNIFGLSNTAINLNILGKVTFYEEIVAVDWYLFSTLLLKGNKAVFTNETETFYRQYSDNTVGLGQLSIEAVEKGKLIKQKHYEMLKKENAIYKNSYAVNSEKKNIKNPLWWEQI
ncbi:glycosyltransferase family A protein [Sulfurimonas sp. HSL3-2]|uniref:glycosyltransferase family A protein n=1 Tax=Hydrocurvibacter mobilis TaxID=3131936 RepID=UPI0031F87735